MFGNLGYLSKAPQFNSVIDINNNLIEGYKNQFVKAVEFGAKYASKRFASNLNVYRTGWENRPVNRFRSYDALTKNPIYSSFDESVDEERAKDFGYNLLAVDALHSGLEIDFSYEPMPKWDFEGILSLGNWRWANDPVVEVEHDRRKTLLWNLSTHKRVSLGQQYAFDTLRINGLPDTGECSMPKRNWAWASRLDPSRALTCPFGGRSSPTSGRIMRFDAFESDGIDPGTHGRCPTIKLIDFMAGARIGISQCRCHTATHGHQRAQSAIHHQCPNATITLMPWTSSNTAINQMGEFNASRATVFVGAPRMLRLSCGPRFEGTSKQKTKGMNLKNFLAATATLFATSMVAQDNIQDVRDNYNIGQTVTVVGVVTSDDNLGSVRYLQDASAGIAIYPGQDWSSWDATPQIGDSLSVTGPITEYNGLLEIGGGNQPS